MADTTNKSTHEMYSTQHLQELEAALEQQIGKLEICFPDGNTEEEDSDLYEALLAPPPGEEQEDTEPSKVLNFKSFYDLLDNKPIFTRSLIQGAAQQLEEAKKGNPVLLRDCFGVTYPVELEPMEDSEEPELIYWNLHKMVEAYTKDEDLWDKVNIRRMPISIDSGPKYNFNMTYDWKSVPTKLLSLQS